MSTASRQGALNEQDRKYSEPENFADAVQAWTKCREVFIDDIVSISFSFFQGLTVASLCLFLRFTSHFLTFLSECYL